MIRPHEFDSDGTRDYRDRLLGCRRCPLLYDHRVHHQEPQLVVADAAAFDARRLGEREPTDA